MRTQSVCAGVARPRVAGGDRGLERVRAEAPGEGLGAVEGREAAPDQQAVPAAAVLVEQQDRLARGAHPGAQARRLDLHQRDQAVHLGLARGQPGEDAPEAQGVLAEGRAQQVVARRRRVPLVEDEVDDLEHRTEARAELGTGRHLEGDAGLGEGALGPHDALRQGRLGHQERARDLVGGQPAEQAQRERDARVGRQHRVTGREDQPEQVVADLVVHEPPRGRPPTRRPAPPARARSPRACARASSRGAGGRCRGAWPWP